ncbi:YqzL family protein [Paenibacillus pini]|uniref:YqzL family protein n=1 Tax=Paenibacillus pini JCM 16418 TaxID=1236976 RepID=W7YEU8_9BACL|nr:YqzL family protein [Paenibacillus pini]GAF07042.1 hypothetical protein JCM16418_1029 [Paenibacillus pini JCM 16418]
MRDFSWKYFAMTGDVDAYLLYKEADGTTGEELTATPAAVTWNEMEHYEENE